MNRTTRRRTSLLAIIAVILAQLAISAFACDMALVPSEPVAIAAPCHEPSVPESPLCQRHCHEEAQSQSPAAFVLAPFVPSFVAALPVMRAPVASGGAPVRTLLHAISPPLAIVHCCLRV